MNNKDALSRSRNYVKIDKPDNIKIFSGSANVELAKEICERLGLDLGKSTLKLRTDGELNITINESVRGMDTYIIQPTCNPTNDNLIELFLMISLFKRLSAKKITAVIPYYGYGRADRKMNSRVPISAADIAKIIEKMGVDRVIALDLHSGQIQGFFSPSIPVDNLEAQNLMAEYILNSDLINNYDNLLVVSPDAGGVYRLIKKTGANIGITMIVKQRAKANEIEKMELVGNVEGKTCIIIDDMIDTAGTLCKASNMLKENGADKVFAFATHGLFTGKANENIDNSCLEKVIVTNSIPANYKSNKIDQISVGILIAEAIRRVQNNESLSELFKV